MSKLSYKTVSQRKEDIQADWYVIDLADLEPRQRVVGRLATRIAHILRGKHKPSYTPHNNDGDHIIVLNADQVVFTGKKMTDKVYTRYTGYPGGQRFASPKRLMERHPERIIENAVKGMLPKNRLGRAMYKKLHVSVDGEHKYQAQNPQKLEIS